MPGICSPTYTLNPYKPVSIEAETPEPKPNILCLTSKCKRILFSIPAFRDRISGGRKKVVRETPLENPPGPKKYSANHPRNPDG